MIVRTNYSVSKTVDFANRLSRSGVSPDIDQLLPAGETPALLSRNQLLLFLSNFL